MSVTGPTKRKGPIHPVGKGSLKDFPNDASQLLDPPKREGPPIIMEQNTPHYGTECHAFLSQCVCLDLTTGGS